MPTFSEALDRFKRDGFFSLDTNLQVEQIERLKTCVNLLRVNRPEIPFYQFHLTQVEFIPVYLPRSERVGAVVVAYPAQGDWSAGITNAAFLQKARLANELNRGLIFNVSSGLETPMQEPLKNALYCLLSQVDTWSSIKLDQVFFSAQNARPDYLNADFHNDLLAKLAEPAASSLQELSLKPFSLSNSVTALIDFLAQSLSLETLHLQITEANRDDYRQLSQALVKHPNLQYLDFASTQFDEAIYVALSTLLDENYRIKGINIAAPTGDESLIDAYKQFNQRVLKPCHARFKEERLSQDKLLALAFQTLAEREKIQLEQHALGDGAKDKQALLMERIKFLFSDQGTRATTDAEKASWLIKAEVLPAVYANHKQYLKEDAALLQLQLRELVLGRMNTAGYLLLEQAFAVKDTPVIQCLLEAKANLFELPPLGIEKLFLVRLLETEGPWQEWVIAHLKKDLNVLLAAIKILSPYEKLAAICKELKSHLDTCFSKSENKKKQPKLLHLLNDLMATIQDEPPEWVHSWHPLVLCIEAAMDEAIAKKVSYEALFTAEEILTQIVESSNSVNAALLHRSAWQNDLLAFTEELDKQLRCHQTALYYREKNKPSSYSADAHVEDNSELEKTKAALAQSEKERTQEGKRHAKEKALMKAEIERLKRFMQAPKLATNLSSVEVMSLQGQEKAASSTGFFTRPAP